MLAHSTPRAHVLLGQTEVEIDDAMEERPHRLRLLVEGHEQVLHAHQHVGLLEERVPMPTARGSCCSRSNSSEAPCDARADPRVVGTRDGIGVHLRDVGQGVVLAGRPITPSSSLCQPTPQMSNQVVPAGAPSPPVPSSDSWFEPR